MAILSSNGISLPAPIEVTFSDEIIWSSKTGRTAIGVMVGDVIAEKKKIGISWGILTAEQYKLIQNTLKSGFVPITFTVPGINFTITSYRGSLNASVLGELSDGIFYFKSVAVTLTQK